METRARQMLAAVVAAGTIAVILAALSLSVGVASAGQGDSVSGVASCSKATALKIATQLQVVPDPTLPSPVASALCGPFTGRGSEAMVAVFSRGTCLPSSGWAVFRLTAGTWRLVLQQSGFSILSTAGTDIRETRPIWRPADPPCNPTGGTNARTWHWNGSRLVAGRWKQATPGRPKVTSTLRSGYFKTPSGNIVCYHSPGPKDMPRAFLACGIKSGLRPPPPHRACQDGGYAGDRVELFATGRVFVPSCAGDPGALVGETVARVLRYGKTWSGGGLRCTSALTGLTCRNTGGHGFFLSREKWRSF